MDKQLFIMRKTGETVEIVGANGEGDMRRKTDWVSYIDSNGEEHPKVKGLNLHWDFKFAEEEDKEDAVPDFQWFTSMAFLGLMISPVARTADEIVESAVNMGKAMYDEVRQWRELPSGEMVRESEKPAKKAES